MKHRAFAIACALAFSAVTGAPAFAADRETRQMMADIRMLQEQSQEIQNVIAQLTDALKAIDARVTAKIDEQTNVTRKSLADQKLVVDAVSRDLGVLREKVDDNSVRLGSLTQEIDALRDIVAQLNAARTTTYYSPDGQPPDLAPPLDALPPAAAPTAAPVVGASPQKVFEAAQADFWSGNYALAISGFEAYIRSFPKSDRAPEAQLNIGNSYLNDKQYDKAVEAYDTTIRTYPGSSALSDAYYRKGVALQSLNQNDAARAAFETVVQQYPDTDAARLATQRLPSLRTP
jgi:tol-pal system protein YbgF